MSSAILYGLSKNGYLPKSISHVSKTTGTRFRNNIVVIGNLGVGAFFPSKVWQMESRLALPHLLYLVNIALIED